MSVLKKTVQFLLAAVTSVAFAGACSKNDDAVKERVDEAKAEAKDLKDRAERHAEHAKEEVDRQLDATKAAADRRVEQVKEGADRAKDDLRQDVRGADAESYPNTALWRAHWQHFTASPSARWNGDDDWIVERGSDGEFRAHRRVNDLPAGARMDDDAVTTAVKGRLAVADDTRPSKIDVDTKDGVVTLKGKVPTNAVAGEAVRLALGTKGVRTVVSHLDVR